MRHYGANKKNRILIDAVLELEIVPKVTTLGKRRTFVVDKFDLGEGDMKLTTITIRSFNIHTPEPLCPATCGDCGGRAAAATTTTTGDTTITDPVLIRFSKVPATDLLNDEAFRVVVSQPLAETHGWTLSLLTEAGGSVVGGVLSHDMDAYTM